MKTLLLIATVLIISSCTLKQEVVSLSVANKELLIEAGNLRQLCDKQVQDILNLEDENTLLKVKLNDCK